MARHINTPSLFNLFNLLLASFLAPVPSLIPPLSVPSFLDENGRFRMPSELEFGCDRRGNGSQFTRIALTVSATTDGTTPVPSPLFENVVGALGDIYMATADAYDKEVCVKDDLGQRELVRQHYRWFALRDMDILLGPSSGEFDEVAESVATESNVRIILWSLPRHLYEFGSLEGAGHFTSSLGLNERVRHTAAPYWRSRKAASTVGPEAAAKTGGKKGRSLREGDLPLVLRISASQHDYLRGILRILKSVTSSLTIFALPSELPFQPSHECFSLPTIAEELGYTSIQISYVTALNFMGEGRKSHSVLIWCNPDSTHEMLQIGQKGLRWDPDLVILSRPNVISRVMMNIRAHSLTYAVEPTLWPSIEELLENDDGLIWDDYLSWWSWHTERLGQPPPLMSHQAVAALELCQKMTIAGYFEEGGPGAEAQAWDWRKEAVRTMYGSVRFKEDGTRLNAMLAAKQVKPWPLETNSTFSAYMRRFSSASMLQVVSSVAKVRQLFSSQSAFKDPARLQDHPINSNTFMTDLVFPRLSWQTAELELLLCKTGCQGIGTSCLPCARGTYRGAFDVRCRQCEADGEYADVPGLGKCRTCPDGATCNPELRAEEPQAKPGFYKVRLARGLQQGTAMLAITDSNSSSPFWLRYCAKWSDTMAGTAPEAAPNRGPEDQGPLPGYMFAPCMVKELCLGGNQCFGHNTGVLCGSCKVHFTYRHLGVDTGVCEPCRGSLFALGELATAALIFIAVTVILLFISYLEVHRIDSIKGPLLVSLLHHLHTQGTITEILDRPIAFGHIHAPQITLAIFITRPFDVTHFDCILDQTDPIAIINALLWSSCLAYIIGLVLCFVSPGYQMLARLFRLQSCPRRQSSKDAELPMQSSLSANRSERRFIQMHEALATKTSLMYSRKRCLVWTLVFYPVLVRAAALAYYCTDNGLDMPRLRMDFRVQCDDPELSLVRGASLAVLTLFGLGFPLALLAFLRYEIVNFPLIQLRVSWGVLIGGYRRRCHSFLVLKILRTWSIIACGFFRDTDSRRTAVLIVFLVTSFVEMSVEPHARFHMSALPTCEAWSMFSLILVVVAGLIQNVVRDELESWMSPTAHRYVEQALEFCTEYGDVIYLVAVARKILFSHVALPLHIAIKSGATITKHVRIFMSMFKLMYPMNSVGVVTEEFADGQQDTYLYVGALTSRERSVMKVGIGEVMHVALHTYDKIHPTLIVNSIDEAARRAGQNRAALQLHIIAMKGHGSWLYRLGHDYLFESFHSIGQHIDSSMSNIKSRAKSVFAGRPGNNDRRDTKGSASSNAGSAISSKHSTSNSKKDNLDKSGFYTVQELYTAMQDVVMDILDRHPLLRNVAQKEIRKTAVQQRRRPPSRGGGRGHPSQSEEQKEEQKEDLFEKLASERAQKECRTSLRRFQGASRFSRAQVQDLDQVEHHQPKAKDTQSRVVNFDELVRTSADSPNTQRGLDGRIEDLRRAVKERRESIKMVKHRLEQQRRLQDLAKASMGRPQDVVVVEPLGQETDFLQLLSAWRSHSSKSLLVERSRSGRQEATAISVTAESDRANQDGQALCPLPSAPEGHPPSSEAGPPEGTLLQARAVPRPKSRCTRPAPAPVAQPAPSAAPPLPPPATPTRSVAMPPVEQPTAPPFEVLSTGPSLAGSAHGSSLWSSAQRRRKSAWKDLILRPSKPKPIPEDSAESGVQEPPLATATAPPAPALSSFVQPVAEEPLQGEARSSLDSARSSLSEGHSIKTDDAVGAEELAYLWSTHEARQEARRLRSPMQAHVPPLSLPAASSSAQRH